MTQIFLNYRTRDEPFGVAMLDQVLSKHFSAEAVFFASKSIPLGAAWENEMFDAVSASTAVLVIMGRRWADTTDEQGNLLLEQPGDFVRREILLAFELGKKVIPVLLETTKVPQAKLPPELRRLAECRYIKVGFRSAQLDIERLAAKLRNQIPELRASSATENRGERAARVVHADKIATNIQGDVPVSGNFIVEATYAD